MILDDGGDATLLMHLGKRAEKDLAVLAKPTSEEETCLFAAIKAKLAQRRHLVQPQERADHRRDRGDDDRRAPPEGDAARRARCCSAPSTSTTRSRRASSTTCTAAARSLVDGIKRATDVMIAGKVAVRRRLRRRRQGLGAGAARALGAGLGDRDRPDQRAAGGDGRLQGRDDGVRRRQGRHLRHRHRQQERHHPRAHGGDEGPGDRLQHRPLRQRDRRRRRSRTAAGKRSSRRSTT